MPFRLLNSIGFALVVGCAAALAASAAPASSASPFLIAPGSNVIAIADALPARPTAAELSKLFADLKVAKSPDEARTIEQQIWLAWIRSGDAAIDALVTQSVQAMNQGQLDQSLALLDAVVLKAPDYAEGWNKRATVLYMVGEFDRSMADIEKVLALEPRHFGAISGIGLIKLQQGDQASALLAYRKVLDIYPLNLGAAANIKALEKLLQGDPT